MGPKKRTSAKKPTTNIGQNGKTTPSTSQQQQQLDDPKEPFAFVLYEVDSQKGVVETTSIPKKFRARGKSCKVPNPIDWVQGEVRPISKDFQEATITDFGYDIDFLYGLQLSKDGIVDEFCDVLELLAEKKICKDKAGQQIALKEKSKRQIDNQASNLKKLLPSNIDVYNLQHHIELRTVEIPLISPTNYRS